MVVISDYQETMYCSFAKVTCV